MSKETTIWITRHGKTFFNLVGRVQGWCDAPLIAEGRSVAQQLARGIADVPFAKIYSSDLGRARQTAAIILDAHHNKQLTIVEDTRLREYCFGQFEGQLDTVMREELSAYHEKEKKDVENFADDLAHVANRSKPDPQILDAEDAKAIHGRVMQFFDEITQEAQTLGYSDVLLVTHGVWIATLWREINNLEGYKPGIPNCSIMKIRAVDRTYTMLTASDISYLK
jgi:broad specificity phosphatase PhoE